MSADIHRLAKANDLEGLRALLDSLSEVKAAVEQVDGSGGTPLFYAVSSDRPNPDLVELLLKAGSDSAFEKVTPIPQLPEGFEEATKEMFPDLELLRLSSSAASRSRPNFASLC